MDGPGARGALWGVAVRAGAPCGRVLMAGPAHFVFLRVGRPPAARGPRYLYPGWPHAPALCPSLAGSDLLGPGAEGVTQGPRSRPATGADARTGDTTSLWARPHLRQRALQLRARPGTGR